MTKYRFLLFTGFLVLFLASCGAAPAASVSAEVDTLQRYMRALADKDEAAYTRLVCPSWEAEAFLEFDAYRGMKSSLNDLNCRKVDSQGGSANVSCQGSLSLSYGNEKQTVDLSPRLYRLISTGDSWQVCGFTTQGQ